MVHQGSVAWTWKFLDGYSLLTSFCTSTFCPHLSKEIFFHVWMICVMVQLDKVEICELKPKVLPKDEGGLVWRWTSNWVTRVWLLTTEVEQSDWGTSHGKDLFIDNKCNWFIKGQERTYRASEDLWQRGVLWRVTSKMRMRIQRLWLELRYIWVQQGTKLFQCCKDLDCIAYNPWRKNDKIMKILN